MIEFAVKSFTGSKQSNVSVSAATFGREFNEPLIHQVVTAFMAGARAGTKAQKARGEVSGGGKKPWKQKGSGRARAGSSRSPIWRKGGKTFAAKPRDYEQKLNRKMYRSAMCSILSELKRQERITVVDNFEIAEPRTREAVTKLKQLSLSHVLIVTDNVSENLYLSTRNIPYVAVCEAEGIDPLLLVQFQNVIFTVNALKRVEEMLA